VREALRLSVSEAEFGVPSLERCVLTDDTDADALHGSLTSLFNDEVNQAGAMAAISMRRQHRQPVQVGQLRIWAFCGDASNRNPPIFEDEIALTAREVAFDPLIRTKRRMLRAILCIQSELSSDIGVRLGDELGENGDVGESG